MGAYWHGILIYHLGNNQILGKIFQALLKTVNTYNIYFFLFMNLLQQKGTVF